MQTSPHFNHTLSCVSAVFLQLCSSLPICLHQIITSLMTRHAGMHPLIHTSQAHLFPTRPIELRALLAFCLAEHPRVPRSLHGSSMTCSHWQA